MATEYVYTKGNAPAPATISAPHLGEQLSQSTIVYAPTDHAASTNLGAAQVFDETPGPGQFTIRWNDDLSVSPLGLAAAEAEQDAILAAHDSTDSTPTVTTLTAGGPLRGYHLGTPLLIDLASPGTITLPPAASFVGARYDLQAASTSAQATLVPFAGEQINGTVDASIVISPGTRVEAHAPRGVPNWRATSTSNENPAVEVGTLALASNVFTQVRAWTIPAGKRLSLTVSKFTVQGADDGAVPRGSVFSAQVIAGRVGGGLAVLMTPHPPTLEGGNMPADELDFTVAGNDLIMRYRVRDDLASAPFELRYFFTIDNPGVAA